MLTPRILIQERDCPMSMQNDSALKTNIDLLLEFLPLPTVYLWGHMTAVSREQSVIEGVVTFFVAFLRLLFPHKRYSGPQLWPIIG